MFLPKPREFDGTPTGNSYLSLWLRCRRKWFAKYLWPWADGAAGLEVPPASLRLGKRGLQGPGANLMVGSALHAFKEHWYRSGIRDGEDTGEYSLDAGLAALDAYLAQRAQEFEGVEAIDWVRANVGEWMIAFHRFYGPGGHTPLFPGEKILCLEDGTPAIEVQFSVPLSVKDAHGRPYVFTCRMDTVALWQDRYLVGLEHKSAAASWADRYVAQLSKQSQFTGELFTTRNAPGLAHLPWDKLRVAFHLKGWTPRSTFPAPVIFGETSRTPEQLQRFQLRVEHLLVQIDAAVDAWHKGLEKGIDPLWLADRLFPETGENTGECFAFNSQCEFTAQCQMGFGPGTLGGFRPARAATEIRDLSLDSDTASE